MKYFIALAVLGLSTLSLIHAAGQHHHGPPPICEPGYQMIEEVTYQEVVRFVCKAVPDVKKKWVYSCIDDPFCIQETGKACGGCDAAGCPNCAGPFCRKQLVKRQIDEPCPTTKCVVEKIVERVPCVTYRKVPCAPAAAPAVPRRTGL